MQPVLKQVLLFVTAFCAVLAAGLELRSAYGRPSRAQSPTARGRAIAEWPEVVATGIAQGPPNAPYTLVLFSDYECPACRSFHHTLEKLTARYPDSLRVITRHMPLSGIHRFARAAARAATCAHAQARFSAYERLLYDSQDSIGIVSWIEFARRAAVPDVNAFDACLSDPDVERRLAVDERLATRLGFKGTPSFLVAGRAYEGAWPDSAVLKVLQSSVGPR